MSKEMVGVPTVGGIKESFKDFGLGLVAGVAFIILSRLFGGFGVLAAPLLVGSIIKGDRGKIVATVAGFMVIAAGAFALTQKTNGTGANSEVM